MPSGTLANKRVQPPGERPFPSSMETLPPSGLARSLPPTPETAGARGFVVAAVALLLLCGALCWGLIDGHDTSTLWVDRELDFARHTRRIMYGTSLGCLLFASRDAGQARVGQPALCLAIRIIAAMWLAAVIWALFGH